MKKLSELDICKRIAEINNDSIMLMKSALGTKYMIMGEGHDGYREYNPLKDDALAFRLLEKFGVNFEFYYDKNAHKIYFGHIEAGGITVTLDDCDDLKRFICEGIITGYEVYEDSVRKLALHIKK